jgi:hypothetical protein
MNMNTPTEEEIKAWWAEFEIELAKMTIPCVPMSEVKQEIRPPEPKSKISFGDNQFMIADKKDD